MRPLLACCLLFAAAAAAQTGTENTHPEVARLRTTLHTALTRQAEAYNDGLLPLAEDYVLALRRLAGRLREAGDTAGAEAVRTEAQRFMQALADEPDPFETVPELTREHLNKKVEPLRLIQEDYAGRRTVQDLSRAEKALALAEKYTAALDQLHGRARAEGQEPLAAAARKEATRVRVVLQRKDAANRLFAEAGARCRLVPPVPDVANLKERAETAPPPQTRNLSALTLEDLSPAVRAALMRPLEYDPEWPPEIVKWRFEQTGPYAHDFSLYRQPGMPEELGLFAYPKTMRAYVRGTKRNSTVAFSGKALSWLGKGMSWRLNDSRDLVCKVIYRTKKPAVRQDAGPAACVAVYSINENNRLIASMSVSMLAEETQIRMAKHYSYNRMNIVWEGSKRKRGFTIPDHMPMRVVVGIAGFAPGEEVDATIEIVPCGPLGDMW